MGKKGQYFTIDAFAAMLVIATGVILVFAMHAYAPSDTQQRIISQEFVNTLAQARVKEINNPFISQQIRGGNITNRDNTLLEQAYEFKRYFDSNPVVGYKPGPGPVPPSPPDKTVLSNLSAEFLESVSLNLIPSQFRFSVIIDGDRIYGSGGGEDESAMLVSSKRIIFGAVNGSAEFWGPVTAEVRVWT
jgi:hypothetical protein